jgi:hypothetical protein
MKQKQRRKQNRTLKFDIENEEIPIGRRKKFAATASCGFFLIDLSRDEYSGIAINRALMKLKTGQIDLCLRQTC